MNEKIKQLAQNAGSIYDPQEGIQVFNKEKFAQLVVRECCVVMNDHDSFYGEVMMSPLIKKHFGIEE